MKTVISFGERLAALRKKKFVTQERFSSLLNITPQAVSKWENGQALPDIALLPDIAVLLEISIDKLLTGSDFLAKVSPYDTVYKDDSFYWGMEQSPLAEKAVKIFRDTQADGGIVLDIGAGEGRDSVYFAKSDFNVEAIEISAPGIKKIRNYCALAGCKVNVKHENFIGYSLSKSYDLIYSMGALQFLPPAERKAHFEQYKNHTAEGGLNAHLIFVEKPFIDAAPDWQENEYFYLSGDLAGYYHDWEILFIDEQILNCNSGGMMHQHAVSQIIARKINKLSY